MNTPRILGLKMTWQFIIFVLLNDFFEILNNERDLEIHGNYFNGFSEKILIWAIWAILVLKMACPHNSGSTLRIFLNFAQSKGPSGT